MAYVHKLFFNVHFCDDCAVIELDIQCCTVEEICQKNNLLFLSIHVRGPDSSAEDFTAELYLPTTLRQSFS